MQICCQFCERHFCRGKVELVAAKLFPIFAGVDVKRILQSDVCSYTQDLSFTGLIKGGLILKK